MNRRLGVFVLTFVGALLVMADSASAGRIMARLFCRVRCRPVACCHVRIRCRPRVHHCWQWYVPCCQPVVVMPAVCDPVDDYVAPVDVDVPTEAPDVPEEPDPVDMPPEVPPVEPEEPAEPEVPVEPEPPVEVPAEVPAEPMEPVEPPEPPEPAEPEEPMEPVEPVEPVEPPEPPEPAEPVEPEEPMEPVEPVEPVEPADPVEPAEPEEPMEPVEPVEPEEPMEPAEPAEPAAPAPPIDDDPFSQSEMRGIRMWVDNTGTYSLEARFVGMEDGTVRLQAADGRYFRVTWNRLSDADQRFVRQLEAIASAW